MKVIRCFSCLFLPPQITQKSIGDIDKEKCRKKMSAASESSLVPFMIAFLQMI